MFARGRKLLIFNLLCGGLFHIRKYWLHLFITSPYKNVINWQKTTQMSFIKKPNNFRKTGRTYFPPDKGKYKHVRVIPDICQPYTERTMANTSPVHSHCTKERYKNQDPVNYGCLQNKYKQIFVYRFCLGLQFKSCWKC